MAELTKRIRAAHLQQGGGGLNQHHHHAQQAAAATTVERYNPIGSQDDDPHMPKPLSVVVKPKKKKCFRVCATSKTEIAIIVFEIRLTHCVCVFF